MGRKKNKDINPIALSVILLLATIIYLIETYGIYILITLAIIASIGTIYFIVNKIEKRENKKPSKKFFPEDNCKKDIKLKSLIGLNLEKDLHDNDLIEYAINTPPQNELEGLLNKEIRIAIIEGETFYGLIKSLSPKLKKIKVSIVQYSNKNSNEGLQNKEHFISKRRIEMIYDINSKFYSANRYWKSIQEHKEDRPYLRYIAVMDEETREQHRKFHNLVLPVDDPFWLKYFPPNGWRCRCRVLQMSEESVKREGLTVSKSPKIKYRKWVNKKTGAVHNIPVGLDPWFDTGTLRNFTI